MNNRSKLVKMRIENIGCIGAEGLTVELDDIVCLVGPNNSGKSTVLRAYEAAVNAEALKASEFHSQANGKLPQVEIWVHIPKDTPNIDEKWKEEAKERGLLLVRSRWVWNEAGSKPVRSTWNPEAEGQYAEDGNAAGLDNAFKSRLPKPFRTGSLENPDEEHKELLKLVIEPVATRLRKLMETPDSELRKKADELRNAAQTEVAPFQQTLAEVQKKINRSYQRVFSAAEIEILLSLGNMGIDLEDALTKASHVGIKETFGAMHWNQQGTGSQRALFWSMLEVRSELKRAYDQKKLLEKAIADKNKKLKELEGKKLTQQAAINKNQEQMKTLEDELAVLQKQSEAESNSGEGFLPGYMLLIDEPETALHPSAIRAAKDHLYSLASESGWQVMLSTHHPAFVDPLEDHTTIVRLHRPDTKATPNVYRSEEIKFSTEEKRNLQSLLAFDAAVAEMFFGPQVVIIEGDTEFAAFSEVMNSDAAKYPTTSRPLLLRARGKATISALVRILTHFKVGFCVLHDIDSPRTKTGKRKNSAYTVNKTITEAIATARQKNIRSVHRCSCPNFEQHHGMELPEKDKPFETWTAVRDKLEIKKSAKQVLAQLLDSAVAAPSPENDALDGSHYESFVKDWAAQNAADDPAFDFAVIGDAAG